MSYRTSNMLCASAICLAWAVPTVAAEVRTSVDIAPQPLAPALSSFARQTGQQLLYSPQIVSGKRTRGVQGSLLPSEALGILLDGTTLAWQRSRGGAIVLKTAQNVVVPVAMSDAPAIQRSPVVSRSPDISVAPTDGGLDIVVTARRRTESLLRTPVSAVAFTANDLYTRSLTRISELQSVTPGLQVGYSAFRTNPTLAMRGQRRATVGEGAPAVLIYQNEIPLPSFGSLIPTFDMSSVQVLKGPQGTLFGRNATAGAVLAYSQQPTYELGGYVDARFTNFDGREFEGAINVPLIAEKVAVRIAGQLARRDGYTKNLSSGPDLDDRHDESIRASVLAEPTENLSNIFIFDRYNGDEAGTAALLYNVYPNATAGGGNARIPALAPFFDCGTSINCDLDLLLARQQQVGPRRTFVDTPVFVRTKLTGVSNTTTWEIGDIKLKNIFGYRNVAVDFMFDLDGTSLRVVQSRSKTRTQQFTEEFQASGKLLNDRLDFIVGGFYLHERPSGINYQALSVLSPGTAQPFNNQAYRRSTSKAIYGQIGYDLDELVEGLKFNAGVRRTKDNVSLCSTGVPGGTTHRSDLQCSTLGARLASDFKATTWTLGLDWQISREVFAYVASRRGYRAGGINTPKLGTLLAPLQSYSPETITDLEVGVKAAGRLGTMPYRLSVAAYKGWYKNIQRNYTIAPNFDGDGIAANDPGSGLVLNSGAAILRGLEFDALVRPLPDLSLSASGAYTDAYYTKLQVSPLLASAGLIPPNAINNKFPFAPSWTYGGAIEYSPKIDGIGKLLLRADYYHSNSFYLNDRPAADTAVLVKAYDTVNAKIGLLDIADSGVDASLFANNLFNKTFVAGSGNFAPPLTMVSVVYGAPRIYGLQMRYRWGN